MLRPAKDWRLPKEMQDTHATVSEIDLSRNTPTSMVAGWLNLMSAYTDLRIEVVFLRDGVAVAVRPLTEEELADT